MARPRPPPGRGATIGPVSRRTKRLSLAAAVLLAGCTALLFAVPGLAFGLAKRLERGLAGLEEREVAAGDHRLVYLEGGSGPTLLLVHGFAADKDNWTRLARHLSDRFHLVAPDLPGHGESDRLESASYDIRSQVERLRAFRAALGLERFHLAGNSMGGHIAAAYAAAYPADVESLILLDAAGVEAPEPSELSALLERGENPLVAASAEEFEELLDFLFVERPYVPAPILDHFAEQAAANREFHDKIWSDLGARPLPLEGLLPSIAAPTLVIWGDSDRVLHPSGAEVFQKGIPRARTVMLEGCGHVPMLERPEEVARHVLEFTGAVSSGG